MAEVMGADWKPQNQKKKGKKGKKGVKGQKEDDEVKFPASRGSSSRRSRRRRRSSSRHETAFVSCEFTYAINVFSEINFLFILVEGTASFAGLM